MAARNLAVFDQTRYAAKVSTPQAAASTTYKPLEDGTAGTKQTLRAMRDAVLVGLPPEYKGYKDPTITKAARSIAAGSVGQIIVGLYFFARDQIHYIDHPWNLQVVQDATRTMQKRTGDCVSKSVLLATLLASSGIQSRFVAQASTPEGFDHVYVEAEIGQQEKQYIALDPTADGRDGRPLGDIGWTQTLSDGGFEYAFEIFDGGLW